MGELEQRRDVVAPRKRGLVVKFVEGRGLVTLGLPFG